MLKSTSTFFFIYPNLLTLLKTPLCDISEANARNFKIPNAFSIDGEKPEQGFETYTASDLPVLM